MAERPDLTPGEQELARAEELVDQGVRTVSTWVSRVTVGLLRTGARAREEAEDIVAEARTLADHQQG